MSKWVALIDNMALARSFHNAGEPVEAIAKFFGRHQSTIRRWLKITGVR